jgi:uncharacterized protein YqiB (DUF1249 family)
MWVFMGVFIYITIREIHSCQDISRWMEKYVQKIQHKRLESKKIGVNNFDSQWHPQKIVKI